MLYTSYSAQWYRGADLVLVSRGEEWGGVLLMFRVCDTLVFDCILHYMVLTSLVKSQLSDLLLRLDNLILKSSPRLFART